MRKALKNIIGWAFLAVLVLFFFWVAGRWDWVAGWAFILLLTCGYGFQWFYIARKDRELIRRREELGEGTKAWDRACLAVFGLSLLAVMFVGALDAGRFQWSAMPWWLWFVGAALFVLHIWIFTWAMSVNTFFEKTVRIQTDRGHQVIDTGPYRFVRHPGYASTIFGPIIGMPLLLGSWWAFLPAVLSALGVIVRTALEDHTLQRELPGYAEYAQRTRYRLLPGIW